VKPENFLLSCKDINTAVVKLADLSLAKEVSQGLATPSFSPYYVPPEILLRQTYDISCDIWALGVIMYILCCGYPPFRSKRGDSSLSPGMGSRIVLGQLSFEGPNWTNVSQDAKDLISGMLQIVPSKRLTIENIMKSNWIQVDIFI
jgi:serine/threonine protein kinase